MCNSSYFVFHWKKTSLVTVILQVIFTSNSKSHFLGELFPVNNKYTCYRGIVKPWRRLIFFLSKTSIADSRVNSSVNNICWMETCINSKNVHKINLCTHLSRILSYLTEFPNCRICLDKQDNMFIVFVCILWDASNFLYTKIIIYSVIFFTLLSDI